MLSTKDIHQIVLIEVRKLSSPASGEIDPSTPFADLGLDSLTMARLFIQLEQAIGADPLGEGGFSLGDIRTVNDLTRACTAALARHAVESGQE